MKKMSEYLGRPAARLLRAAPFREWPVERSVDDDTAPTRVSYSFPGCGLQLICDPDGERIRTVFLRAADHGGAMLSEIPFRSTREQVLAYFGTPSKSGEPSSSPILGDSGAWDRFRRAEHTVHVQFRCDSDRVEMITLMRNDVVP